MVNDEWIGLMAASLTTVAFVPQVIRTWQMGGRELSWLMLTMFGVGVGLWLVYGVRIGSTALMLGNGLTLLQVALMALVKVRTKISPRPVETTGE